MRHNLFGTSGIRGVVNNDLTPELVLRIGLAVATFTNSGRVAVGFDTRQSSGMVTHSLIAGLLAGGAEVENHGMIPTPVLAYLASDTDSDAGVMVTASHNPPEYNGVKIFDKDGMALDDDSQKKVEEIFESTNLKYADWRDLRRAERVDYTHRYIEMVKSLVVIEKRLRVVVDPGCGAAYSIGPRLFREVGCEVLSVNAQPDGFFPGRPPEPTAESLSVLSRVVKETRADAGVAYDGDADRMALVDEFGDVAPMDQLIAAYAAYLVSAEGERTIVVPVDASMCIDESVEEAGGKVIRTPVGDVNVARAVLEHKAALGAEASGAWINPDYSLCPDGILSSMLVLAAVSSERLNTTLSEFVKPIPKYPILRTKVACPREISNRVMNELQLELLRILPSEEVSRIDGLRLSSPGGWVLVRLSGTEPVLRVTVEAKDPAEAESLMSETINIAQRVIRRVAP
ncbi:MAG: phosphoglucosamine mutase [Candidatus Bathyarchaeia archaeon]